jgi:glycerol-3-phosphate dehydrogenase
VHPTRIEHLLRRYGSLAAEVLDLIRERPELAEPLPGADDYLGAEVVYAVSHEGALHLDDVLARRTRVSIEAWDRGVSAAPVAAALMAAELGWSKARTRDEVEKYLARVEAERASQREFTDEAADRVRLEAPEPGA